MIYLSPVRARLTYSTARMKKSLRSESSRKTSKRPTARCASMEAYAQSKLAITIWSRELARELPDGPVFVAVNPGSLLASKMVKEGFGVAGNDLSIGADILCKAALDPSFASASGAYFDNDAGRFADPNVAALDSDHSAAVMTTIEQLVARAN